MQELILNVPLGLGVGCYREKHAGCTRADAL